MRRRFTVNKGFTKTFDFNNYLTIEALEDNFTVSFFNDIEYGIDGKGWIKLKAGLETLPINTGQTLSFRGKLTPNSSIGIGTFIISKKCNLKGNCMSMLFGDDAANNYSLFGKSYAFYKLFNNCAIIQVSDTFLPATTLDSNCYQYMFGGCNGLTTAPELPATTLADYCYNYMFGGCYGLTTAPSILPATILADYCYDSMFSYCGNLTTAPELPATTLASDCYCWMFYHCDSLTTAPELPATTLSDSCYSHMFYKCISLRKAPELPATTLAEYCYSSMFYDCTSLTTAPELPATTLVDDCYHSMFNGCSKLNYIKMLATDISANKCLEWWVSDVSSTGTFVKNPDMTTLPTASYYNSYAGIPSGWTVYNDGEEPGGD